MKFWLPASVFIVVFLINFVTRQFPSLPDRIQYVPDLFIATVGAVAIARLIAIRRFGLIPLRYCLVSFGFVYVVASGFIVNLVAPDVAFAGIRFYFKYVPLFLLPFAYDYSTTDTKRLGILIGALALLQVPETLRQRFTEYTDDLSGDAITGTLSSSTPLSLFLVGMIVVLVAYYADKRISFKIAFPLGVLFLLPATINETKITPIAIGVGVVAVLFARRHRLEWRRLVPIVLGGCVLFAAFVAVYDQLYRTPDGTSYVAFMSKKENVLDRYNLKGIKAKPAQILRKHDDLVAKPVRLTDQQTWIGRLDSVTMPFDVLKTGDRIKFMFGLGIGSVSSRFGGGGDYAHLATELGATYTTITQMLWETGLCGTFFGILLIALILRDSLLLSQSKTRWDTLGVAWFGVSVILLCTLAYTNLIPLQEITCLIAFFAGLIVSKLQLHQIEAKTPVTNSPAPTNQRASRRMTVAQHPRGAFDAYRVSKGRFS